MKRMRQLTRNNFTTWLRCYSSYGDALVGKVSSSRLCPLANFIRAEIVNDVEAVTIHGITTNSGNTYYVPKWGRQFIRALDVKYTFYTLVSQRQALAILKRV